MPVTPESLSPPELPTPKGEPSGGGGRWYQTVGPRSQRKPLTSAPQSKTGTQLNGLRSGVAAAAAHRVV